MPAFPLYYTMLLLIPIVLSQMDKPEAETGTIFNTFLNESQVGSTAGNGPTWDVCNADPGSQYCREFRTKWEDKVYLGQKLLAGNFSEQNTTINTTMTLALADMQSRITGFETVVNGVPYELTSLKEI